MNPFAAAARVAASDGAKLIRLGRFAQAALALERAVDLDPRAAASHHDLGLALLSLGRLDEARKSFAAAVALNPRLPSAHHNLAHALDGLGRVREALASYEAAVRLQPDRVPAQRRLADLYLAQGRRREAAVAFRAVAAATAGSAGSQIAEARAKDAAGDRLGALEGLQAVAAADPANPEARLALGQLLGQAGRSAEAAEHLQRVAELSPDNLGAAWLGVATHRRFGPGDDPLIARMNACLARPKLRPAIRQSIHFALGKALDDMEQPAAAMRHFDAANVIRARGRVLDREALARRIDDVIEATPSGYLERRGSPGVDDATPVLIMGMPRSGTTLVEQILSSHPKVAAGGELGFWGAHDVPDTWSTTATERQARDVARGYLEVLREIGPDALRVTDKAPFNYALLGVIHRVFPKAILIHCRRHPIDTCLSIFTTNFEMNFDFAANRGDLAFYYRQYRRLMAHWREVLPAERLIEVDYESLVADPEPHTRRLVAACGLDWDDACLSPERNDRSIATASMWQARQPIYRTSVERWRRYAPWLGELRELAA